MKTTCCIWLVLLAMSADAGAGAEPPSAWDLVHPDTFDGTDRQQRRQLAEDLLARVLLLSGIIPPQGQDQLDRLRAEEAALEALGEKASARRRARLYLSRAYQHRQAIDLLDGMTGSLVCARDSVELAREMVCWAKSSSYLLQEDRLHTAMRILREARLVPRDSDMPVKAQDPLVWYGEYGRGILTQVLVPHLEAQAGTSP